MLLTIIILIIAVIALLKSADLVVKTLMRVAIYFRLSEFTIGFLVLAVATSVPELFVAFTSAFAKIPELALGDVLGANIVDLTLVVGVVLILSNGLKIKSEIAKKDILYMIMLSVLPLVLMLDQQLSRLDGIILLAVFGLYMFRILSQRKLFRRTINHTSKKEMIADVILLAGSMAVLLFAVKIIVDYASVIATELAIPAFLIGVLMLGIGTTLPELSSSIMATLSGLKEMAIGDLLGSVVINATLVLGVASIIHPIQTDFLLFAISAVFMVFALLFFAYLTTSKTKITWKAGVFLIVMYLLFIILEVGAKLSGWL